MRLNGPLINSKLIKGDGKRYNKPNKSNNIVIGIVSTV